MDPHSRLSQFNKRRPSTGPSIRALDHKPRSQTTSLEQFKKQATGGDTLSVNAMARGSTGAKRRPDSKGLSLLLSRPIATNSRLIRDEKIKRDMYLAFVDNALSEKAKGNNKMYNDFVQLFSHQKISANVLEMTSQLRSYLTALSHVVSKLDRSHISLVDAIIHMPWSSMSSVFVKSYISFLGMLVSARPEYLNAVADKTVQGLTYQAGKKSLSVGFAETSSSPLTRRVVYDRVHSLLEQLLSLVPTLPSILYPILARYFPHKRQAQYEHVTYVRNLLRLSEYCHELSERVLGLVIDKTIQIDVEIQVELEELESGTDADEDIFPLDIFDTVIGEEPEASDSEDEDEDDVDGGFSDLSSEAGSEGDDERIKEQESDTNHVRDMVTKLDCILEVIFKHLDRRSLNSSKTTPELIDGTSTPLTPLPALSFEGPFTRPASPVVLVPSTSSPPQASPPLPEAAQGGNDDEDELEAQRIADFHTLLAIFDRTILRTFKSRYTQFLLFWYSSLSNAFRDLFLGMVLSKALLEIEQPAVTRATAASYVASYVSRANFVDRTETRSVVNIFCNFIEDHLNVFDQNSNLQALDSDSVTTQSAEQHAVFYAAAQAVFLIFCFRWRDLLELDPNDLDSDSPSLAMATNKTWLPKLNIMQRAVTSVLNPLKICSGNVVLQFAHVAQRVGFMYCYPIIEANKRADYANPPSGGRTQMHWKGLNLLLSKQSFNADLSTFFPFDPYKLPRSSSYIEAIYRDWTAVAIDDDEEDDEDDEEGDESYNQDDCTHTENEDAYMCGPSSFVEADELGTSFGGMSISPIHHMRPAIVS